MKISTVFFFFAMDHIRQVCPTLQKGFHLEHLDSISIFNCVKICIFTLGYNYKNTTGIKTNQKKRWWRGKMIVRHKQYQMTNNGNSLDDKLVFVLFIFLVFYFMSVCFGFFLYLNNLFFKIVKLNKQGTRLI